LPEHLRTAEGRRAALKEAKQRFDQERQRRERTEPQHDRLPAREPLAPPVDENQGAWLCLRLEAEAIVDRSSGRRGWLRAARQQFDRHREYDAPPVRRSRIDRLLVRGGAASVPRELEVEHEANRIYEAWRARGIALDGSHRMAPRTTKPYQPPEEPGGRST
jgi:hypothetical protein